MDAISKHAWETAIAVARAEASMVADGRTLYAVRLANGGFFAAPNHHWTPEPTTAQRFGSMTAANGHAIMALGLGPDDYTIEAV